MYRSIGFACIALLFITCGIGLLKTGRWSVAAMPLNNIKKHTVQTNIEKYPVHRNITSTVFWVGEDATEHNAYISNSPSAWDEYWVKHFGGVDTPEKRNGYFPAGFRPKENPFYIALPYNDFREDSRKANAAAIIPWAKTKVWAARESMCKNQWVKITRGKKTVYAQWEDSGPFLENDAQYVFGNGQPRSAINNHAGIDVSPAISDYLGLTGINKVDWQFIDAQDVPDGPWKEIVTTSQIFWK